METIEGAGRFGIQATRNRVDWAAIVNRVTATIDDEARQVEQAVREATNMQVFRSRERFLSPFELQVGEEHLTARHVVIAAGTRFRRSKAQGIRPTSLRMTRGACRSSRAPCSSLVAEP